MIRIRPGGPCQSFDTDKPQHPCFQPVVFKWTSKLGGATSAPEVIPVNCSMGYRNNENDVDSFYPLMYQNFSNWPERCVFYYDINNTDTVEFNVEWALGEFSWGGIEHYIEIVEPVAKRAGDPIPVTYGMYEDGGSDNGGNVETENGIYIYNPKHSQKYQPKQGCLGENET
jgi:hypothetical protein